MARYALPDFYGRRYGLPPGVGYDPPMPWNEPVMDETGTGDADMGIGLDPYDRYNPRPYQSQITPGNPEQNRAIAEYARQQRENREGPLDGLRHLRLPPFDPTHLLGPITQPTDRGQRAREYPGEFGREYDIPVLSGIANISEKTMGRIELGSGASDPLGFLNAAPVGAAKIVRPLLSAGSKAAVAAFAVEAAANITNAAEVVGPAVRAAGTVARGAGEAAARGMQEAFGSGSSLVPRGYEGAAGMPSAKPLGGGADDAARAARELGGDVGKGATGAARVPDAPPVGDAAQELGGDVGAPLGKGATGAWERKRTSLLQASADEKLDIAKTFTPAEARRFINELDAAPGDDPAAREAIASALEARLALLFPGPMTFEENARALRLSWLGGENVDEETRQWLKQNELSMGGNLPPRPEGGGLPDGELEAGLSRTLRMSPNTPDELHNLLDNPRRTYAGPRSTQDLSDAAAYEVAQNPSAAAHRVATAADFGDVEVAITAHLGRNFSSYDNGTKEVVMDAVDRAVERLTEAGRTVQAASIVNAIGDDGRLMYLQRQFNAAVKAKGSTPTKGYTRAVAESLKNEAKAAETTARQRVARGTEQVANKSEAANALEGGGEAAKTNKVSRSWVDNAITFLENEGRNPKNWNPGDDLKNAMAKLKGYSQQSGWLMPHDVAEGLHDAVAAVKDLPKAQRAAALDGIARDIIEDYLPKVEARAKGYIDAKATETALDNLVTFANRGQGVNPNVAPAMRDNDRTIVGEAKRLLNQAGGMSSTDPVVSGFANYLQEAVKGIRALDSGEQQRAIRSLVDNDISGRLIPALREIRAGQVAEAKQLRFEVNKLMELTGAAEEQVRTAQKMGNAALTTAQTVIKAANGKLSAEAAQTFINRGRAINEMGTPLPGSVQAMEQWKAAQSLMHDMQLFMEPKWYDEVLQAIGLPRQLKTMWDFSAPFRQGVVLAAGHPKKFAQAFKPMWDAARDPEYARNLEAYLHTRPLAQTGEKAGLYLAPLEAGLARSEEALASRFANKIPGAQGSQRAFVTFLNKFRADVFDSVVDGWVKQGYQYTEKDLSDWAGFINIATGRGSLPKSLEQTSQVLNGLFFAPRFAISRAQLFGEGARAVGSVVGVGGYSKAVGRQVGRDLAAFVGGGSTALGLLSLAGADVGMDPRSSDFGKAQIGGTRIDVWGGEQQIAATVARLVTGERVTSGGKSYKQEAWDTLGSYLRNKLAPVPALVNNLAQNENVVGRTMYGSGSNILPAEPTAKGLSESLLWQELAPLYFQDVVDAFNEGGVGGVALAAPLALVGIGAQSYKTMRDLQNDAAREMGFNGYTDPNLTAAQKREVDASDAVRKTREEYKAREEYNNQEAIKYGLKSNEEATQRAATEFQRVYPHIASGEDKRKYIQKFKETLRISADATLGAAFEREARGEPSNTKDALAAKYWAIPAPVDLTTGDVDHKAWKAERQPTLDEMSLRGYDPEYATRRDGQGFLRKKYEKLPEPVRKELDRYDQDQETLDPFWDLKDKYANTPKFGEIVKSLKAAEAANDAEQAKRIRATSVYQLYDLTLERAEDAMRYGKDNAIEKALMEWGHRTVPIAKKKPRK